MRSNPVLWRITEWLYSNLDLQISYWNEISQVRKNAYYDKVAVLYAKIINNDFTGTDNHKD